MPETISRKTFEKGNFNRYQKGTKRKLVIELLNKNKDTAFTIKAIAKRAKVSENSVRRYMKNLRKSGDVLYNSPFFIWRIKPVKVKKKRKVKSSKKVKKKPVRRK